jgi:hypothetical protein
MNYGICLTSIRNINPSFSVYNTRFHKKIEDREKDHLEAHYKKEEVRRSQKAP